MTFQILITWHALSFFTNGLNGKLTIYLVLTCLAELTLLAVIELRTDTKRDLSVHCVPALILANKSIKLVKERFYPGIGTVLLVLHHRSMKRAS